MPAGAANTIRASRAALATTATATEASATFASAGASAFAAARRTCRVRCWGSPHRNRGNGHQEQASESDAVPEQVGQKVMASPAAIGDPGRKAGATHKDSSAPNVSELEAEPSRRVAWPQP